MFELNITSSRDISSLKIDFADGTSTCTSSIKADKPQKTHKQHKEQKSNDVQDDFPVHTRGRKEQFLDTDADYSSISQEIVQLPKIDIKDRPVHVAPELQNLDF